MALSIRDHIEAGHYPKDVLGRPQVPGDDGSTWSIICTDKPYGWPIVGFRNSDGTLCSFSTDCDSIRGHSIRLLPPPPRKVKVTGWARIDARGRIIHTYSSPGGDMAYPPQLSFVVELTGEYVRT